MKTNGILKGENGVIMMETLIMLPVYLVLLACIFWLGELCLIRQTLTTAEQVRLWEDGTRHNINQIAETVFFKAFLETEGKAVTSTRQQVVTGISKLASNFQTAGTQSRGWGAEKSGFVQLNTRRSEWSWGIVNIFNSLFWGGWDEKSQSASGRDEMNMYSRVNSSGVPQSSCTLFRRDTGERTNLDFNGNTSWNSVYLEKWGNYVAPGSQGDPRIVTYYGSRYGIYVGWSE